MTVVLFENEAISQKEIVAVYVLNQECDEEYQNGNWNYPNARYYIIHRLCVNPKFQNQGIARQVMQHIEKELQNKGIESIRLDAFTENPYSLKLYQSLGYAITGHADWRKGRFYLMEKSLNPLIIKIIEKNFSVCKVENFSQINLTDEYCFLGKTEEEMSIVCETDKVPQNTISRDDGWKAFRIQGVLDFSLIGILAKISTILAEEKIGIFAISTYNTDYILTKAENFHKAIETLKTKGYQIIS